LKADLFSSTISNSEYGIQVTGSKSESNRLLILQALFPEIAIANLSESDDTQYLKKALESEDEVVDIHHAGTAMRFLTAYFATQPGREVVLTGSPRMQERPIGILVDALRQLGANISYEKNEGFPPLRIKGSQIHQSKVTIQANTSSQYISALLLVAPSLANGLEVALVGEITSVPYLRMTLELLERAGIKTDFNGNKISVPAVTSVKRQTLTVESDWSSASYFYSIAALSDGMSIKLTSYRSKSLQGDAELAKIYELFGVKTSFITEEQAIVIEKLHHPKFKNPIKLDLINTPDIAQTIAVTCFGLGIGCKLKGLHTLKIKETDRLVALKVELEKLGAEVKIDNKSLKLAASNQIHENCTIHTYNDHRMAMAFAPLALKTSLTIDDCMVVSKSFPSFWDDLKSMGILMNLQ